MSRCRPYPLVTSVPINYAYVFLYDPDDVSVGITVPNTERAREVQELKLLQQPVRPLACLSMVTGRPGGGPGTGLRRRASSSLDFFKS